MLNIVPFGKLHQHHGSTCQLHLQHFERKRKPTSTVSIVKVGVQPFLQKPADLLHAPLLNILHEFL